MGRDINQVIYKCGSGCNYGSCNKTNAYVFIAYRGTDTFTLYHKQHLEDPNSKLKYITGGEDFSDLPALIRALTGQYDKEGDEKILEEIRDKKLI